MGYTSETNTIFLSRDLFLGVVALKPPKHKFIICVTWPFSQVLSHINRVLQLQKNEHCYILKNCLLYVKSFFYKEVEARIYL